MAVAYVSVEKKTETRPQSVSSPSTRHGHAHNNSWKDVSGIFASGITIVVLIISKPPVCL